MEKIKTRVAIVHNGKDSDGYKLAKTTFAEQALVELFEPVMIEVTGANGIEQVVANYKEGKIDTVVDVTDIADKNTNQETIDSQWEQALGENGNGIAMLLTENARMVLSRTDAAMTPELMVQTVEKTYLSMKRDFRISNPRIAILHNTSKSNEQDDSIAAPAIKQLTEQSIQVYGPYDAGEFFENGRHLEFDAVIATNAGQGITNFKKIATDDEVRLIAGLTLVRTQPAVSEDAGNAEGEETAANKLRQAIYKAIDIVRNRREYDKPLANPLKKLYKDRKDESEKSRFNISKKKEQTEK